MSCVVTGAAGFIGSHLSEALVERGFSVVGVDRFSDFYPRERKVSNMSSLASNRKFKLVDADLTSMRIGKYLGGVDYVFHLAAQPGVRGSWGDSFSTYVRDNVIATQRLLEAAAQTKLKRFVFASSSSVYGDSKRFPTAETAVPKPISPYGVTKLSAEHLCSTYFRNYNVPSVSLRYFTVYGPRQRPDMAFSRFIDAALNDEPITIYGDGSQVRDFTYVQDIVKGTIAAAESDGIGDVFNLGGGRPRMLSDVVRALGNILGRKCKLDYREAQRGDVRKTSADITRARSRLGFKPSMLLEDGLREQVEWAVNMGRKPSK